jgi:hypothetical protein
LLAFPDSLLSSGTGNSFGLSAKALGSKNANRARLIPADNRRIKSISLSEQACGDLIPASTLLVLFSKYETEQHITKNTEKIKKIILFYYKQ